MWKIRQGGSPHFLAAGRIGRAFTPGDWSVHNASLESSTHHHTGTSSRPKKARVRLVSHPRCDANGYARSPAPRASQPLREDGYVTDSRARVASVSR